MADYLRSLDTMLSLAPRVLYPGHGPVVEAALDKLREYIEHRHMRERQVLQALQHAGAPRTPEELVPEIYGDYPEEVHPAAARSLLERGAAVRDQIRDRLRLNDATLRAIMARSVGATVLPADGGWSGVIRVPATRSEEALVTELLERDAVVVHPGYFFDFPHEAFLVVSLLPEPGLFARGVELMQDRIDAA